MGAYTRQDIENWSDFVARIVTASGVTEKDIIQISFGIVVRYDILAQSLFDGFVILVVSSSVVFHYVCRDVEAADIKILFVLALVVI